MAEQVAVDAVAHMRRDLGDVDGRERVDADMDAVLVADAADVRDALVGQRLDRVRRDVDLEIEIAHAMLDRGRKAVLDAVLLAEIDADALAQIHGGLSEISSAPAARRQPASGT